MRKLFVIVCAAFLVTGCGKAPPQLDKNGQTPIELAAQYYEAVNNNDVATIKAMYSSGYYNSIVTKRGFLKTPDHKLFDQYITKKLNGSKSIEYQEKRSGFHSNNAEGVFSAAYRVVFTDEGAKKIGYPHLNDELCFKLVNNEWKITDKLEGF